MAEEAAAPEDEAPALPDVVGGSMADLNRLFGQAEQSMEERSAARKQAAANIRQRNTTIEQTMKTLAERKLDVEPPEFDFKEFQAPKEQYNPVEAFGSTASTLGMLASLFTKTPLTSALNASATAMNAFKQRDVDTYNKAFAEWKTNTDFAYKRAAFENDQYKTAIDLMNSDFTRGYAYAKQLSALNQDEAALAALSTQDPMDFVRLVEGREKLTSSLLKNNETLYREGLFNQSVLEAEQENGGPLNAQQLVDLRNKAFTTPAQQALAARTGNTRYNDLRGINEEEDRLLKAVEADESMTPEQKEEARVKIRTAAKDHRARLYSPKEASALDQKIAANKKAYPNISDENANKLALNKLVVKSDPVTKRPILVDIGAGTVVQTLEAEGAAPQPGSPTPAPTSGIEELQGPPLWSLADALTGPEMALASGISDFPIIGSTVPRWIRQARTAAEVRSLGMERALAQNPKFPVTEMQKIKDAIDIGPKIWSNPDSYKGTLISLDKELAIREAASRKIASDKNQAPAVVGAARNVESIIAEFRRGLGIPNTRFDYPDQDAGLVAEAQWILTNPKPGTEYVNYRGEPARVRQ